MNIDYPFGHKSKAQVSTKAIMLLLIAVLNMQYFGSQTIAQATKKSKATKAKNTVQKIKEKPAKQQPSVKPHQGIYYEISKQGQKHTSYLYGTLHAVCKGNWELPEKVKQGISDVYTVYMEVKLDDKEELNQLMKSAQAPADSGLNKLFNKEELEKLHKISVDSFKINLKMLNNLSPLIISSLMIGKFLGCNPTAVDMEVMQWAHKKTRNLYGLEKAAEQMQALGSVSYKEQAKQLSEIILNQEQSKKELLELVNAYLNDDLNAIDSLTNNASLSQDPNFNKILLEQRNNKWMATLKPQLNNEATFIAVGAAHLSGEKGLIKLIEKEGYQVKPIPLEKVNP